MKAFLFIALAIGLSGCGQKVCVMGIGDCSVPISNKNNQSSPGDPVRITAPSSMKAGEFTWIKVEGCNAPKCDVSLSAKDPAKTGSFGETSGNQVKYNAPASYSEVTITAIDDRWKKDSNAKGKAEVDITINEK